MCCLFHYMQLSNGPPADKKALRAYTNGEAPAQFAQPRSLLLILYLQQSPTLCRRNSKDPDQTAWMRRMAWELAFHICSKVPFLRRRSIYKGFICPLFTCVREECLLLLLFIHVQHLNRGWCLVSVYRFTPFSTNPCSFLLLTVLRTVSSRNEQGLVVLLWLLAARLVVVFCAVRCHFVLCVVLLPWLVYSSSWCHWCSSLLVHLWFHIFGLYLFPISPSFGGSWGPCFVIVASFSNQLIRTGHCQ